MMNIYNLVVINHGSSRSNKTIQVLADRIATSNESIWFYANNELTAMYPAALTIIQSIAKAEPVYVSKESVDEEIRTKVAPNIQEL